MSSNRDTGIAEAAVRIVRQTELPSVLKALAEQSAELVGGSYALARATGVEEVEIGTPPGSTTGADGATAISADLVDDDGTPFGCVQVARPGRPFEPADAAALGELARIGAAALLHARVLAAERAEAHHARVRAEQANASKSEFLAVMSHELRTPLNAIAGYTDLIRLGIHGPVTGEQLDDLERIQRSQRHLLALINNVLDYAKIEGGRVRVLAEDVPVEEVINSVIGLITPQFAARRLTGHCTVPRGLQLRGDREKVEQILINLMANAVKFTPQGGRISVEARAAGDNVQVCVSDSGAGIPPDMRERIFEPFVQLNSPLTAHAEGTGLGLAICRDLASLMGGTVTLGESTEGATFILTLPRACHGLGNGVSDDVTRIAFKP